MELFKDISAEADRLSPLVLAFIGDTVYDLLTRGHIIAEGNAPVNTMHTKAKHIVNATAQSRTYSLIEPVLTEEDLLRLFDGGPLPSENTTNPEA